MSDYATFLAGKLASSPATGINDARCDDDHLFPFQRDIVTWAIRRGRCALFADTGLGKTRMQIAWADRVQKHTGGRVLILAPLSVAKQTASEGEAIGVQVTRAFGSSPNDGPGIYVTNYDKIHKFADVAYDAVVLDESSIIKHHDAKTLAVLLERFRDTPFKLCASATPSPNDYTELGTHAEFLGVCSRTEMLAEFFCHDGGDTSKWRLKGHARQAFWKWVSSWAALLRRPSDLGYDDSGYDLPPLQVHEHRSDADPEATKQAGLLFAAPASTLTERRSARKSTLERRITDCVSLVTECTCEEELRKLRQRNTPSVSETKSKTIRSTVRDTSETGDLPEQKRSASESRESTASAPKNDATKSYDSATRTNLDTETGITGSPSKTDTESATKNTTEYLRVSTVDVQYADGHTALSSSTEGYVSITATEPERFEGSSVGSATLGSVDSKMTRTDSNGQRHILGCNRLEQYVIWCELNAEQDALRELLGDDCVSIAGALDGFTKELLHEQWIRGERRVLLTKPSIFGFGLNWQHCHKMAFVGVTDSFESYYQAVRREWRFGQRSPVDVHIFYNELEGDVLANLKRKGDDARKMGDELSAETREMVMAQVRGATRETNAYESRGWVMPGWLTRREADCEE